MSQYVIAYKCIYLVIIWTVKNNLLIYIPVRKAKFCKWLCYSNESSSILSRVILN